jgi:hypothetical protein
MMKKPTLLCLKLIRVFKIGEAGNQQAALRKR